MCVRDNLDRNGVPIFGADCGLSFDDAERARRRGSAAAVWAARFR